MSNHPQTLRWDGEIDGRLVLLDQTRLPQEVEELTCTQVEEVWEAIRRLSVRGAPAIGCAAAYGVCVGVQTAQAGSVEDAASRTLEVCDYLATSRPTAVNLFWALDRMQAVAEAADLDSAQQLARRLLDEARAIHQEDATMCMAIGRHGADLLDGLPEGSGILTHCNAGALATGGEGTALAVLFELARRGKRIHVWVDETRPLLQGARLTVWELMQRGIDCTLICDSMAAAVMQAGNIQAVVTGADRIAANGDVANKIGTYSVATVARAHAVPFYVAAPTSTFDLTLATGLEIPIEQRDAQEITRGFGSQTAPTDVKVFNPAFDVTPATMVHAIITERGVIERPDLARVAEVVGTK